jgi:hypothetical protein
MRSATGYLDRMLLRDYAFLERIQKKSSHSALLTFATISTSSLVSLVMLTAINLAACGIHYYSPQFSIGAKSSRPLLLSIIVIVVAAVELLVGRLASKYSGARPNLVDGFSTSRERTKWWLSVLSIPFLFLLNGQILLAMPA